MMVMGYDMPDDAMGYGLPSGHFGKAVSTPRKSAPKAEYPHEPPGPPKNYGADINILIDLLESGRLPEQKGRKCCRTCCHAYLRRRI